MQNTLFAQNILNSNFENWYDNTAYEDPDDWVSTNFYYPEYNIPHTIFKTSDAKNGKWACMLKTIHYDRDGIRDTMPGYLFYGTNLWQGLPYPFSQKMKSISFYYKYLNQRFIDTGVFYIAFYKHNNTTKKLDWTAGAYTLLTQCDTFKKIDLNVYYDQNIKPDTFVMVFTSSGVRRFSRQNGSTLIIDHIETSWTTFPVVARIDDIETEIKPYPNPSSDYIFFNFNASYIDIYDTNGKLYRKNTDDKKLDISDLKNGLYYFNIIQDNKIKSYKFIKY